MTAPGCLGTDVWRELRIDGRVVDGESGAPCERASLRLDPPDELHAPAVADAANSLAVTTAADGTFQASMGCLVVEPFLLLPPLAPGPWLRRPLSPVGLRIAVTRAGSSPAPEEFVAVRAASGEIVLRRAEDTAFADRPAGTCAPVSITYSESVYRVEVRLRRAK